MVKEAEKRKQLKATPLGKRIQRFTKTTFNYKKEPHSFRHKSTGEIVNETGKETGKVIDISKIENLAVVDIDINKTVDDERKEKIRQSILLRLPEDVGLVQTASGGLHIYCDRDDYPLKTDSQTKAYKCSDYDIDVFACVHGNTRYVTQANTEVVKFESEEDKKAATTYENIKAKQLHEELTDIDPRCTVKDSCYISLAGSKEYPNVKNNRKVLHYIDLNNYLSKTNLASLETVLDIFGIDLKYHVSSYDTNIHLTADGISSMPKEFAELLVCGLTDVTIHNYCHHSIDKELSLFPLFNAINSLINIESVDEEDINAYYDEVKSNNTLTANAEMNWDKTRENCSNKKSTPYVLQKIVKIWCPEYYKNTVVPEIRKMKLLKSKSSINEDENIDYEKYIKQIDLYDSFSLTDIRNKSESCQYKNIIEVLSDLSRVIRFIETGSMYIQKEYNIFDKCWCIAFVTDSNMMKSLKMIKLWKTESKTITAYDVLLTGLSKLTLQGVMFNAGDVPNVYSLFQGYKYRVLEQVDMTIISMFLDFIREEIADSNDELFEYVLNWIANIVQHPGIKNETALVLKGLQGIGKNRFTDVLSELFAGTVETID
ncbi:putative Poxvirus D5 protein [Monocercomonoides exilis]|uniref:putative Poxvirus D5 protein n=1 Tax=Monocercomonoides exilis TaxID=2049356 RepID=UPI0035597022|nr:putative Poxvirus D5 protein [Monocercomonoides exilis]|eukprot:MONOS_9167.1-p1 / transcript=MONOS_9167.1 / gene=MONOS_9167 / organism=Monocercomonoides_exilis_PA203 / gene_product=Poxvirus D5 protein / transcript_product=Poxvirus D5 protein / location=Mono_scaffold00369:43222-45118(-) / protein_length=599 / sequence_SO=supercontig / SO=protein_coding / is_pseudo=false